MLDEGADLADRKIDGLTIGDGALEDDTVIVMVIGMGEGEGEGVQG